MHKSFHLISSRSTSPLLPDLSTTAESIKDKYACWTVREPGNIYGSRNRAPIESIQTTNKNLERSLLLSSGKSINTAAVLHQPRREHTTRLWKIDIDILGSLVRDSDLHLNKVVGPELEENELGTRDRKIKGARKEKGRKIYMGEGRIEGSVRSHRKLIDVWLRLPRVLTRQYKYLSSSLRAFTHAVERSKAPIVLSMHINALILIGEPSSALRARTTRVFIPRTTVRT